MSKFEKSSRFSSLIENDTRSNITNKEKKPTTEPKKIENNNSFKNNTYHDKTFKDNRTKLDEKKVTDTLSIENFPQLVAPISVTLKNPNIDKSFSEKLKSVDKNTESESIETDYKNLKKGWTLVKKENNKITIKSNDLFSETQNKTDGDLANEVLDTLVELHENRTYNYIDIWGYEQWEKMFEFPNYDYRYFDKLDELYYQEMALNDEESEYEEEHDDSFGDSDMYNLW